MFAKEFDKKIPDSLVKLVEAKKLGRKTNEGFYKYVDGKPVRDKSKAGPTNPDLQDRLILPMLNESVAVLREQIVGDAELLDAGVIFGTGFAPFRGGPVNYIRATGADKLLARLQQLAQKHGERFKPDAGWSAATLREPKA